MKGYLRRDDDFEERRKHLANLTDEELKTRFWDLTAKVIEPLLVLAKENTSPSIERSVLLRMGFSSLEIKPLVEGAIERGLMGKGVGHIVFRIAKENNISIREAGLKLIEGEYWNQAIEIFRNNEKGGN